MTQNSHSAVQGALKAHAPLVTKVHSLIRPDTSLPGDAYPMVVFRRSDYLKHRNLDGSTAAEWEEFEFECWGRTRSEALEVMGLVMDALEAAGFEPEKGDPDGIDPQFIELVSVLKLEIWTT